jgi:hypothetical protein
MLVKCPEDGETEFYMRQSVGYTKEVARERSYPELPGQLKHKGPKYSIVGNVGE